MSVKRKLEDLTLEEKICIVFEDLQFFSDFCSKFHEVSECSLKKCHVGEFTSNLERLVKKRGTT